MIKHIVMWKLKDEAEQKSKSENIQIIKRNLENLIGKIEGLITLQVGENYNPKGFDLCLYTEFTTKEALEAYIEHPLHRQNQAYVYAVIQDRAVVDFEI